MSEQQQKTSPLVELADIRRDFAYHPVLRSINLQLAAGERVALLGANGTGKTTLIRILAGLLKPAKGSIRVAGVDGVRESNHLRQLVGLVAHQPFTYEMLTATENLRFFAQMYAVPGAKERIPLLLKRVGLGSKQHERAGSFSRGQAQRLAWARALLHKPRLLLLDEAETGLDQSGLLLMQELLEEHCTQGGAALMVTHQLAAAHTLSNRLCLLHKGKIAQELNSEACSLEEITALLKQYEGKR